MENAVRALKMAAAALIFIVALGITFYMFGVSKKTADAIIGMRDKQGYLDAAELDGTLYTTATVETDESGKLVLTGSAEKVTVNGDRVVDPEDVIATLYRYAAEKYAVTILENNGTVVARFDSSIESIIQNNSTKIDSNGWKLLAEQIRNNLKNKYITPANGIIPEDTFNGDKLKKLYEITYTGAGAGRTDVYGAPWLGNETEVQKRVDADVGGKQYKNSSVEQIYQGKGILDKIKDKTVYEVINDIDESNYLLDGTQKTGLLKEYQMPTVEIIYIIMN